MRKTNPTRAQKIYFASRGLKPDNWYMSYMQKILKDRLTDEERQTLRRPKSAKKD